MRKQICKYVIATGIILLAWSLAPCYGGQWQSSEWNQNINVKNTAQGFVVDLPSKPGHLNIVRRSQNSIPKRGTITVTYRITGTGKAISLDPANGLQPNFRPAIFTGDWYDNNGRQWPTGANCMLIVPDGQTKTYTIKLTPKLWSNEHEPNRRNEPNRPTRSRTILALWRESSTGSVEMAG